MQMSMREMATVSDETPEFVAINRAAPLPGHHASTLSLKIEAIDDMASLEAEWRALERDDLTSLHQSYDWCAAWVETYHPPLVILRGTFDDNLALILPLEIVRSRGVRVARFIGAPRSNINTGLFSATFLDQGNVSAEALRRAITTALRGKADLLLLENLALEWRGRKSPLSTWPSVENQNHAFQLPILESFEATLGQLNAKRRRKKHRHQTRMLDRMGGYEHIVARTPEEKRELLDLFLQQKSARFKAAGLPDVFQGAETREYLLRLLDTPPRNEQDHALDLHGLRLKGEHEGHVPAISGLSRKGDHVICQFASIDETRVKEASPGELLFWMMIEEAQAAGVALFDLGIGDQLYKRSWCPVETVQHDVVLPISPLGALAALAQKGLTRAKAIIKANPKIYGFVQRLRANRAARPPMESQSAEEAD